MQYSKIPVRVKNCYNLFIYFFSLGLPLTPATPVSPSGPVLPSGPLDPRLPLAPVSPC